MQIPPELLKRWKQLRSTGDNKQIAELLQPPMVMRVLVASISRTLKKGSCSDNLFKALNTFYTQKEADLFPDKKQQS